MDLITAAAPRRRGSHPYWKSQRELLARALLPLVRLEAPLRPPPLELALEPDDTLRLPTRSPPPPRSMLPACCLPPRSIAPPCCLPPICPWFWRAFACRLDMESPRAVPPYLLAVALFEYGAPPRCWALCCQLLPLPVRLPVLLIFCLFELFTKLLLLFMLILLLPAPPTVAAPASAHGCSNHHSNTKRNRHARSVIARRRIGDRRVRVRRRTVDNHGVIARDIDNFRLGLFYDYNVLTFDSLCFGRSSVRWISGFPYPWPSRAFAALRPSHQFAGPELHYQDLSSTPISSASRLTTSGSAAID